MRIKLSTSKLSATIISLTAALFFVSCHPVKSGEEPPRKGGGGPDNSKVTCSTDLRKSMSQGIIEFRDHKSTSMDDLIDELNKEIAPLGMGRNKSLSVIYGKDSKSVEAFEAEKWIVNLSGIQTTWKASLFVSGKLKLEYRRHNTIAGLPELYFTQEFALQSLNDDGCEWIPVATKKNCL